MRRSVRNLKRCTSNNEMERSSKSKPPAKQKRKEKSDDSSSDSDIEDYLQPIDKIDLNSSFFQLHKTDEKKSFDAIENDIFAGTNRLSDSESEQDDVKDSAQTKQEVIEAQPIPHTSKLNFEQLHSYTKKMEEAKQLVQKYEFKRKKENEKNKTKVMDDDITNLLSLGEMKVDVPEGFRKSIHSSDFESFSESDKEDWEEVEETVTKPSCSIPQQGVQITVALPDNMKKKKGIDLVASMKRRLNRIKKENQILIHKVHLLCWIAHGNYVNKILNSESVLALSLSLIPSQHCYPPNRTDLSYLEQIVNWYKNTVTLVEKQISKQWSLEKVLKLQLTRKQAYNKKMLVYMFISILRSLGIQCRLVLSFQVIPLRPPNSELHSLSIKTNESTSNETNSKPTKEEDNIINNEVNKKVTKTEARKTKADGSKTKDIPIKKDEESNNLEEKKPSKRTSKTNKKVDKEIESTPKETDFVKDSKDGQRVNMKNPLNKNGVEAKGNQPKLQNLRTTNPKNQTAGKSASSSVEKSNTKKNPTSKSRSKVEVDKKKSVITKITQLDGASDGSEDEVTKRKPHLKKIMTLKPNPCAKSHPKRFKSLPNDQDKESEDDFVIHSNNNRNSAYKTRSSSVKSITELENDVRDDITSIMKHRMKQEKEASKSKLAKNRRSKSQSDEDSDYAPEPIQKKSHSDDEFLETKVKVKRRVNPRKDLNNEPDEKTKKGHDVWLEVFLETEEKWISVDVVKGGVHCISGLYSRASHPVAYVITWNNNNCIKDVSQRYCPNWNTTTRKLRIDSKWWTETLKPYVGKKTIRDKIEDEDLARLQLEKPIPTTISEYKNHPLYVLKRHLLKFQALYPPNPPPLGFIRNEPVYARDCVHVLHSREVWIKHAKVVKSGEKPYKIVKARPKYDRLSGKVITDLPLEIFGVWQVEDYVPPTAENGVVPKSAYGSVELFKPCMLPKGTIHLQLPGLNKIARKLNIDSAPALVGFDFHGGWNHPIYDGYVVCEEFAEILTAAWYTEQEEQEKKELEKTEKRVYGNWKKLIKGLLIRERLKLKYNFGESSQPDENKGTKRKNKGPKFATKKRRICSDSESD